MITRPTIEELELQATEERLAEERLAERKAVAEVRQLESQERLAKLRLVASSRHKVLLTLCKAPGHVAAIWAMTLIILCGKTVPAALEEFLGR